MGPQQDSLWARSQADEPQSPAGGAGAPRLVLGYCRDDNSTDVMIPNTGDGDIFWRRKQRAAYRPRCRAGTLCAGERALRAGFARRAATPALTCP